jgi:hypothetical protein
MVVHLRVHNLIADKPHQLPDAVFKPVVPDPLPFSFRADQPNLAKHSEVVRYGGLGNRQALPDSRLAEA